MTHAQTALLGAIAGFTIFIGLPVGRMRGLRPAFQGFLNATATGILIFLLWDILSHASAPVEQALAGLRHGGGSDFWGLLAIFAVGLCAGLLSLVVFNARVFGRVRGSGPASPRTLSLMIASGLGLHNLSEGLAIGQSAASGAVAFASVLVIGFGAGVVCYVAIHFREKVHVDDALDVWAVHGIGGTWGAIATGLFATVAINSGAANGLFYGNPRQLLVQLLAVAASWAYSAAGTFVILKIVDRFVNLRVEEEEEVLGLDLSQHGEPAYARLLKEDA